MVPPIALPTFAGFLATSGPRRVTKILEAQRSLLSPDPYVGGDHYIHLRNPLREALMAGGDPQPLVKALASLKDPKKTDSHQAVVSGLTRFFRKYAFAAKPVAKRTWTHRELVVKVGPHARLRIAGVWHVAFVHLKDTKLDARTAAPILQLIETTHGDLGIPMIIEARTGKVFRPSPSASIRRGLGGLLVAEAEAFISLWHSCRSVA